MPLPLDGPYSMPRPRHALPGDDLEPSQVGTDESTSDHKVGKLRPAVSRRSLAKQVLRLDTNQIAVAVALFLTALAIVVTLRTQAEQVPYETLRRDELIQLLDNVSAETRRLEDEVRSLQTTRDNLRSGAEGVEAAREESIRRRDQLQILAGTVPAQGPGIILTISDPQQKVSPAILLDGIEELRDAGAEVIEFNESVRLTATSWVALDDQLQLVIDDTVIERPITIRAIGDPATLEAGARFRGGLVSEIEGPQVDGRVEIVQEPMIQIQSVVQPRELEHVEQR